MLCKDSVGAFVTSTWVRVALSSLVPAQPGQDELFHPEEHPGSVCSPEVTDGVQGRAAGESALAHVCRCFHGGCLEVMSCVPSQLALLASVEWPCFLLHRGKVVEGGWLHVIDTVSENVAVCLCVSLPSVGYCRYTAGWTYCLRSSCVQMSFHLWELSPAGVLVSIASHCFWEQLPVVHSPICSRHLFFLFLLLLINGSYTCSNPVLKIVSIPN